MNANKYTYVGSECRTDKSGTPPPNYIFENGWMYYYSSEQLTTRKCSCVIENCFLVKITYTCEDIRKERSKRLFKL